MPIRGFRLSFAFGLALATQAVAAPMDDSAERAMRDADLVAGTAEAKAGRYDAAIRLLQRVLASDADNADAHSMLGFAHRKSGDLAISREHLFRFGASALANDLARQILRMQGGGYMAAYDITEA